MCPHYRFIIRYQKFANPIHTFIFSNETPGVSHWKLYNPIVDTF